MSPRSRVNEFDSPRYGGRASCRRELSHAVPAEETDHGTKQIFLALERIGMRGDEAVKQLGQASGQERIARNWTHDLAWTSEFLVRLRGHNSRVEIDDAPLSRDAVHGCAVVHFARVH